MGIANFLYVLTQMYIYVVFAFVIMSWLLSFNIISLSTNLWAQIWSILNRLTSPIFVPLRNFIPPMGGLDLTPLVVLIGLNLLQGLIRGMI